MTLILTKVIITLFTITVFVSTMGGVFREKYSENKYLVIVAAILAVISTFGTVDFLIDKMEQEITRNIISISDISNSGEVQEDKPIVDKQGFEEYQKVERDTFLGLDIGDAGSSILKLKYDVIAESSDATNQYVRLKVDENKILSITYNFLQDSIVYLELNYTGNIKSNTKSVGLKGFEFQKTTLNDIRNMFGSNGFVYESRFLWETEEGIVSFNTFELKNKRATSNYIVFITTLSKELWDTLKNNDASVIGDYFKLEGIILADASYLDSIWGEEKLYDPKARSISID